MYGLVLMVCGALAFHDSGLAKTASSAIYMGNGGAVISFLLAAGSRNLELRKGEKGYKIMMISIHLAFIFPLLFGGIIGWRLWLAWNVPHKAYLKPYFSVIVAMSLLTAGLVYSKKPKKIEIKKENSESIGQKKDM
ncbi:unnamed protein product [Agarophyton chilense]